MDENKTILIPVDEKFVINVKKNVYEKLRKEQFICIIDFHEKMVTLFSMIEKGERKDVQSDIPNT